MEIAILSDRLTRSGGTELYMLDLIDKYLHEGDKVTVFTTKLDKELTLLNNKNLKIVIKKFSTCPKKLRFPLYYYFLKKHLKNQTFDMILGINSPYSPNIGICCGTYLGDLKTSHWKRKLNPINYARTLFEKKEYSESSYIVAHSILSKNELMDLYHIQEKRIKVIYPVPSLNKFKWKSSESIKQYRKKYHLSRSKTYFLFTSTGHRRKGLQLIIQALKILNNQNIIVLVAGTKRSTYEDITNIKYLGYIKKIQELYQACDATLLPSSYEPFGLTIIESLLSGTPVIISKEVGAKDLVKPCLGTVLSDSTATNLADAMLKYTNPKNVKINKSTVYKHIEPYINHHSMIKELSSKNFRSNQNINISKFATTVKS